MKFFPKKKADDEKDKKSITSSISSTDDSKVAASDKQKGNDKLGEKTPSKDSDSTKKGRFDWMPKADDKNKQNEHAKVSAVVTEVKSVNNSSEQKTVAEKNQTEISIEKEVLPSLNNLLGQQSEVQLDETITKTDKVKQLIEVISNLKENTINPSIDFEKNTISYPLLAQIADDEYIMPLLEKLASPSLNILERGVYERLAVCPEHPEYFANSLRLYCSSCFSTDIVKLHLIEHRVCGYITEKKDFRGTFSDINKCISCKNTIKDPQKEIRKLGRWYECNSCKVKFDNCVTKLHCRKFNHDFEINQAETLVIPYYKLKTDTKTQYMSTFSLMPQLKKLLVSHGFAVEESLTIKGKSGIAHKISIYASNSENKTIAIDVKGSETEIDDAEVNSTIVKVIDISPTKTIFIGTPSVSDAAKAMAAAHNISVVIGRNFTEIVAAVEQILKTHLYANSEYSKKIT